MRPDFLKPCTPANLSKAIAALSQQGQLAHVELFRAVLAGEIVLAVISSRRMLIRSRELWRVSKPVVALVGDDDDAPTGPTGWRSAREVMHWAAAAIVHGAAADRASYRGAIDATRIVKRVVLVETSSAHVGAWAELLRPKPVLAVIPRDGMVHPAPSAEVMH